MSRLGRVWYQIVGLFKWNKTPETKFQMVDPTQNGSGLKN
jgi:hypothetical protein